MSLLARLVRLEALSRPPVPTGPYPTKEVPPGWWDEYRQLFEEMSAGREAELLAAWGSHP